MRKNIVPLAPQKGRLWPGLCIYPSKAGNVASLLLFSLMFPVATPRRTPAVCFFSQKYGVPSAALLALCQAALVARAETETVRPRIVAMQVEVLKLFRKSGWPSFFA